jgi:aldehyde dehydrogenase (NAD+)
MDTTTGPALAEILLDLLGPADSLGDFAPPAGIGKMLIDGDLVDGAGSTPIVNIDPSTGEPLGHASSATDADLDRAIAAARRAFDDTTWRHDIDFRLHCLRQLAEGLERHAGDLVGVVVAELGSSVRLSHNVQVGPVPSKFAQMAAMAADCLAPEHLADMELGGMRHMRQIRREPIGVVGAITPWNIPLDIAAAKVAGALAAGNTLVLKPSPETPWVGNLLGRIAAELTDIPAGVFNVITSADHTLGALLVEDARVDAVSFTGSTQTGRRVAATGAEALKRVHLELGGKSPNIVLDDADLAFAVPIAAALGCFNTGQSCILPSRLLVPAARLDECIELARVGLESVPVGDPSSDRTFMGPLVSDAHRARVDATVRSGLDAGGRVVTGGSFDPDAPGFFYPPTLIADAPADSPLVHDEIFGPVVVLQAYDDLDDAIRIANSTAYGLAAYVWGNNLERIEHVASSVKAGMVGINGGNFTGGDMPFGGVGNSGIGREWGVAGILEFTEIKTVSAATPL